MPSQPITAEDLGAALAGFALVIAEALHDTTTSTEEEFLEMVANGLHGLARGMTKQGDEGTPAKAALSTCADMLMASEPQRF